MKYKLGWFSNLIYSALLLSIAWNTGDILFRRWFWNQIPSQVSAPSIYGLLLCNAAALFILLRKIRWAK